MNIDGLVTYEAQDHHRMAQRHLDAVIGQLGEENQQMLAALAISGAYIVWKAAMVTRAEGSYAPIVKRRLVFRLVESILQSSKYVKFPEGKKGRNTITHVSIEGAIKAGLIDKVGKRLYVTPVGAVLIEPILRAEAMYA